MGKIHTGATMLEQAKARIGNALDGDISISRADLAILCTMLEHAHEGVGIVLQEGGIVERQVARLRGEA